MSSPRQCPSCGLELTLEAAAGLCVKCVFAQMLAPPPPPAVKIKNNFPRPFGDYELIAEIARGGMGIVYKARQLALNRLVALKVIVAGELSSPDFVRRFRVEAEAAAGLDHPNIVPIYEIGEFDGQAFFSMRLVDGPTLRERVGRVESEEEERRAAGLVATVARAVHYAHQRGIIHRDLKPNNVLLNPEGEPYLTDFGLAKLVEKESTITRTMAVLGTPSYMAPEQARGETKNLTTAADIYSLGAILYELLAGQPPFAGGTTMETIRLVLDKEPRSLRAINSKVDRDLETICLKCLEKEPQRRYGSAEAMADDLDRWLRHESIAARPSTVRQRFSKWSRRHPAVALMTAALALALTLGFAMTSWQSSARQKALLKGERFLYAARIDLAEEAWATGHVKRAGALLDALRPLAGQEDLRGFEWRYLRRICQDQSFFTLANEQNPVTCVAPSPDGRLLAIAGGNPWVVLYDVRSRQEAGRLPVRDGSFSVAFSPDGARLAVAGQDGAIRIFDLTSLGQVSILRGHDYPVAQVAFSPDGKWLASGSRPDGIIKLWDLAKNKEKASFGRLANEYPAVAFSPDSSLLAWSTGDRSIRLTDVKTGEARAKLTGHGGSVVSLAFSPDGKWLASGSKDFDVRLWDGTTGKYFATLSGQDAMVTSVAFSPDSQLLTTTCVDGTMKLWNVKSEKEITTYKGHEMWINNAAFMPDGRAIVSGGEDGAVKMWAVVRGSPATTIEYHNAARAGAPLGDTPPETSNRELFLRQDACEVRFSADGSRLAVLDDRAIVQTWDSKVEKSLAVRSLPAEEAIATALCPDGRQAISCGTDGKLRLWNLDAADAPLEVAQLGAPASRLALSPNGKLLAEGTPEGRLNIWDTHSWKPVLTNSTVRGSITALKFSPDGRMVLAAVKVSEETNGLLAVDLAGGAARFVPENHQWMVTALTFSPDGSLIAGSSRDGIARLWASPSLVRVGAFRGHSGYVTSAAFAPDGRTLATASNDGTVKLWAVATHQELFTMPGHIAPWTQLAFSPNGTELAACGEAGLIRVWRAPAATQLQ